jgi:D-alanyl-D-alanine carboxypeptidase (penicillin-binding protein 5/6)
MIRPSLILLGTTLLSLAFVAPAAGVAKKPSKATTSSTATKSKKVEPAEPFPVEEPGAAPRIRAASAIVIEANSGTVLHEVNADHPRPVASTQKLLTALLIAEAGNLDEQVGVAASDTWAEPTMLYLKPGDAYPRRRLLEVLLVKSMNDVARCLARDNAGSVETFALKMNARAQQLGMTNSHFVNPNGLPASGQYSTARDMARVAFTAYRNPIIRNIVRLKELTWRYNDGRMRQFSNTNRVLKNYALCNGMKTGYTEASGFCLISSASNGSRDVIAVVLGDTRESIWIDSYRLLAWALAS